MRTHSNHPVPPGSRSDPIRVVLADDHQLMREGVRRLLEGVDGLEVVAEADSGHEVLRLMALQVQRVDVVVTDLNMPGLSGTNLVRRLRQDHPCTAVLVLTMLAEEQYAVRAFKAGASGYLTKDSTADELVQGVRKVAGGGVYLTHRMAERVTLLLARHEETPCHDRLSDREFEIFRLIVAGQRLTDIAQQLHLSIKTVSTHKSRILEKMELPSTAALIRYGLQHRLFPDPGLLPDGAMDDPALPPQPRQATLGLGF